MNDASSPTDAAIYFDTAASAALFQAADINGHFWTLCRYFVSENMLTYCGIASSVTALNSLGVPSPDSPQIYPYKMFTQENFFTEGVLQIRRPSEVEKNGCALEQLASMLAVYDVAVNVFQPTRSTLRRAARCWRTPCGRRTSA